MARDAITDHQSDKTMAGAYKSANMHIFFVSDIIHVWTRVRMFNLVVMFPKGWAPHIMSSGSAHLSMLAMMPGGAK